MIPREIDSFSEKSLDEVKLYAKKNPHILLYQLVTQLYPPHAH